MKCQSTNDGSVSSFQEWKLFWTLQSSFDCAMISSKSWLLSTKNLKISYDTTMYHGLSLCCNRWLWLVSVVVLKSLMEQMTNMQFGDSSSFLTFLFYIKTVICFQVLTTFGQVPTTYSPSHSFKRWLPLRGSSISWNNFASSLQRFPGSSRQLS